MSESENREPAENHERPPAAPEESHRDDPAGYAAAIECVRLVIAWYNRAIFLERRSVSLDRSRLETLVAERRHCVADQASLDRASPAEVARMAQEYGARFRDLTDRPL